MAHVTCQSAPRRRLIAAAATFQILIPDRYRAVRRRLIESVNHRAAPVLLPAAKNLRPVEGRPKWDTLAGWLAGWLSGALIGMRRAAPRRRPRCGRNLCRKRNGKCSSGGRGPKVYSNRPAGRPGEAAASFGRREPVAGHNRPAAALATCESDQCHESCVISVVPCQLYQHCNIRSNTNRCPPP